ncbi:diguanylate cyclase [Geobacter hydrogenophilus]|uniref:diguanylate cyclase n=1 Tax=Geobacter hydrogenophilus TaxID=40983 RepID=A0A9W6FYD1_9BACT|nr:diguanylate cyclase [Geobacter hydrogenophilus]MBT0894940.1 diguanylate cyclase [Geobacter hydrogenophilus]GLI37089.1 diguanylate cyclase response regulator [Geobacter hydrogenophilus]
MRANLRIIVVTGPRGGDGSLELRLQSKGYQVVTLANPASVMGSIYSDPPDVVLMDLSSPDETILGIIRSLKDDFFFSTIPVIGMLPEQGAEGFDWEEYPLDDFVAIPLNYRDLFTRIVLSLRRLRRVFDNNPLTRLPGNTSIQRAIEHAVGKPMGVCYVDINHFKQYNDVYGFAHGDEVIRMVARIISNAVKEAGEGFAGHIGGDDFVFIVPLDQAEAVSERIIANFTAVVSELFNEDEKARGFYVAHDRKGNEERVPLMGVAISIVPMDSPKIGHYAKVAEVAAELKKLAKKSHKSCYVMDRRK